MDQFLKGKFDTVQDTAPPGGYAKIFYERTFPKFGIRWWQFATVGGAMISLGFLGYKGSQRYCRMIRLEDNDVRVALEPFMKAERDRMWLNILRDTRQMEEEVMKNVPGWQTGTWYGEPIYFTMPEDRWWDPHEMSIQAHARSRHIKQRFHWAEHDEYSAPHFWDKYVPKFLLEDWIK